MLSQKKSFDYQSQAQVPAAPVNSFDKHRLTHIKDLSKSSFDNFALSQIVQNNTTQNGTTASSANILPKVSACPTVGGIQLRSIEEVQQFQRIFSFPYFNILQSKVFDEVLYTDKSIVVSAPTGSGKTVVFELALIRLIMKTDDSVPSGKIIYMAPMKALCSERFSDWKEKFTQHGLNCLEVTGDTELDDLGELFNASLIFTTPEKWDSMSRRWKDNKQLFRQIKLFLIDEIHTLNDRNRGATVEAVVSRMKTLQTTYANDGDYNIRFIAVSATMPNYNDIALWLSQPSKPALSFNLGDNHRPVKLERIVLGYPFKEGTSDFRFDMNLSYRLKSIIEMYSHSKPTLVFCSSRKSVVQSAEILAKDLKPLSVFSTLKSDHLQKVISTIHEHKLKEFLHVGIGIHHAGLHLEDRHTVEELFRSSHLPVLVCTSTLAMGVNLPAHLVIIKSTHFYNMGIVQEYSDMQILQMIGRAGRPQFDTFAVSVIMTKTTLKGKYESLVNGTQLIESSLHKHLIEHLNAEIVLQTISNSNLVMEWLKHTFLYVRALKNPKFYGLPSGLEKKDIEKKLTDLCLQNLNQLKSCKLVSVNEETDCIFSTDTGKLMARYCVAYTTIKKFQAMEDKCENIADMLTSISQCSEFEDIQLRTNEKKILNTLNKDKNKETIRFPMAGKIRTGSMKVNCLIQAQLSCLASDFSLSQDTSKIFRVGQRLTKCLMEFMLQSKKYSVLLYSVLMYKAFKTKLWFDSRYVARQLDGIGPAMSLAFANSGLTSFQKIEQTNARDIEMIVNRHPPFGNQVLDAISALPKYQLALEQVKPYKPHKAILTLIVDLMNYSILEMKPSSENSHQSLLIVGDAEDKLVLKLRIIDSAILRCGSISQTFEVNRCKKDKKLDINLLSQSWVGLDIHTDYEPIYTEDWFDITKNPRLNKAETPSSKLKAAVDNARTNSNGRKAGPESTTKTTSTSCSHKCLDKSLCGHKCCKTSCLKRAKPLNGETKQAKQAKVIGSSYFNDKGTNSNSSIKQSNCMPRADCGKQITNKEQGLSIDVLRNPLNSSKPLQYNQAAEPQDLKNSEWNEQLNTTRNTEDICFDLTSNDELELAEMFNDNLLEANQLLLNNAVQKRETTSPSKSSENLDITRNGWADLDAFKLSREELYTNGRPPHLQGSYCTDDVYCNSRYPLVADSEHSICNGEKSNESLCIKPSENKFWHSASSDEELYSMIEEPTPKSKNAENIAPICSTRQLCYKDISSPNFNHPMVQEDNYYSNNSTFKPVQKNSSCDPYNFFQRLEGKNGNTQFRNPTLMVPGGVNLSENNEDSLSYPMSPVVDIQCENNLSILPNFDGKVTCTVKTLNGNMPSTQPFNTQCESHTKATKSTNDNQLLPSSSCIGHKQAQNIVQQKHLKTLPAPIEKKKADIFVPQTKLPLDEQHIPCGLFDGIF